MPFAFFKNCLSRTGLQISFKVYSSFFSLNCNIRFEPNTIKTFSGKTFAILMLFEAFDVGVAISSMLQAICSASFLGNEAAERGGFEPPIPISQDARFRVACFRPLSHLSNFCFTKIAYCSLLIAYSNIKEQTIHPFHILNFVSQK